MVRKGSASVSNSVLHIVFVLIYKVSLITVFNRVKSFYFK